MNYSFFVKNPPYIPSFFYVVIIYFSCTKLFYFRIFFEKSVFNSITPLYSQREEKIETITDDDKKTRYSVFLYTVPCNKSNIN